MSDIKDQMKDVYYLEDMDVSKDGVITGFEKLGKGKKPVLLMAYASWCPHCETFKPEYQKIADEMKGKDGKVHVAAIRADGKYSEDEKKLAQRIREILGDKGFRGYPHVCLYDMDGKFKANFEDERTAEALRKFIASN